MGMLSGAGVGMGCFEQIAQSVHEQILQSSQSQSIKDKHYFI